MIRVVFYLQVGYKQKDDMRKRNEEIISKAKGKGVVLITIVVCPLNRINHQSACLMFFALRNWKASLEGHASY